MVVGLYFAAGAVLVNLLLFSPQIFAGSTTAGQVTPLGLGISEGIFLLFVCIAALIIARIEHRSFSDYGLPLHFALRRNFWVGTAWGFIAISGTLLVIFVFHGSASRAWRFMGRRLSPRPLPGALRF